MAKSLIFLERETGFEPATFSLGIWKHGIFSAFNTFPNFPSIRHNPLTFHQLKSIFVIILFTRFLLLPRSNCSHGCSHEE